ncbi:PEFG-CTERM sorting domain-containing protein [Candidatus Nitrosotenuis aquarius]|uniref:PEFG-CTERM sorting domain-containing protein n=1 Tax=Candidatus Nitrosotenuis aquarius TaxID=1846278 RepID=UPI000C1F1890|nr:PEFG-CTERM sorting domain-containing protein [Candidatus Nitrosotenuis aquarius]
MNKTIAALAAILFAVGFSYAHAEESEKESFASALEETLGHLHALELNLNESNSELARTHATHPIAELYESMKPELQEHDADFDAAFETALSELADKTIDAPREEAQAAIDEMKSLVEEARTLVVGDELSSDPNFRLALVRTLVETAGAEYAEAVEDGTITEMVEYQDGSAFVWRAQQIFSEIKADLPEHEAEEIEEFFADLDSAIKDIAPIENVQIYVEGIEHEVGEILGDESEEGGLHAYFEGIEHHLAEVKETYADGDSDAALAHATKAYLDNYEFLEAPVAQQNEELMEEIEIMMREELRDMIKAGAPADEINSQVDAILVKLEEAEALLPMEESEEGHEEEHEEDHDVMAPLKQVESGVAPEEVQCNGDMVLIIKSSTGSPACVKTSTADRLVQLGWGTRQ